MILLDRVTKRYGTKTAVQELSLEIPAGELFAFLGPNGAGKTTTIKMMCGLLFPTAGRVRLGGYDLALDRDYARRRLDEVIDLFQLQEFVDDLTQRYSHGMRQRTVFAAALLHEPSVLIVDEPTVGLDPRSIRLLKDVLRNETKRGATVFLSTHSLDIAQELSDRIGV